MDDDGRHSSRVPHPGIPPGNKSKGDIAPELGKLVESGAIRILDLVFITKDADGNAAAIDFEDHHDVARFIRPG